MNESEDKTRLGHMVERIQRIQTAMQDVSEEQFYQSPLLLDGVTYNFAILGEAANNVSDAIQGAHPEIPWGNIIGMRNILVHDYMKSKPHYLWQAVVHDLPPLLRQLEEIMGEL